MRKSLVTLAGIFAVLLGLGILLNLIFKIHIPVFQILFAVFLLYIGGQILLASMGKGGLKDFKFEELLRQRVLDFSKGGDLNLLFGKGRADLTFLPLTAPELRVKLTVLFGVAEIRFPKTLPIKITVNAVFAGVRLPVHSVAGFGTSVYTSETYREGENHINLYLDAAFGGADIHWTDGVTVG